MFIRLYYCPEMTDKYIFSAFIFFVGLCLGSFFYTLSLRFSSSEKYNRFIEIFYKPSYCYNCGEKIGLIALIPLVGYVLSIGKCRKCGYKISTLYPAIEFLYAILGLSLYLKFGFSVETLLTYLFLCFAVCASLVDYKKMIVPDSMVVVLFIIAVINTVFFNRDIASIYGMLFMFIVFFLIIFIFPGGFGGGDLKYSAVLGLFSGLQHSILILEVALVSGSIFGIIFVILKKSGLKVKIPFSPFLTLGLVVSIFFGTDILLFYWSLI